jgi:M6 family metalloprotease-like protein
MRLRAVLAAVLGLTFTAWTVESAHAVPAYPDARITLEQPSGEKFKAGLYGDEWSGGYETLDGYAIEQDLVSERWEYAKRNSLGRLVAGGTPATDAPPPGLERDLQESRRNRASRAGGPADQAPDPPNTGTQPTIVILAEFTDQATLGTTPASWASRFFGASDSVSDYYDEVSFGDLDIAPGAESHGTAGDGVVGWVNIGQPHPGSDSPSGVITTANQQTFKDAVAAANPFIDYSAFDSNGNGSITPNELHITVITAGGEASICGTGPFNTWGHKWWAGDVGFPVADSVEIEEYTMFGEAHCDGGGGGYMATLGIMVHEIGHDLDWPDYYDNTDAPDDPNDTGANGDGGVGQWSVMATGSWAAESGEAPGETPPHPDAFNKSYQGWINPTLATGTSTQSLGQAATNPDAVQVLDNPGGVDWTDGVASGTGEYFLIENRQLTGYDAALPGCGILIWHVDETRGVFNNNNSFDARRLLDLEEADGGSSGLPYSAANAGDAFLGGAFNASSNPNSNLYNGSPSGVSVSSISSSCAATMSASVTGSGGGGDTDPPETTILSFPDKKTKKVKKGRSAKFVYEYGSDESPVSFECNINGSGWQACFQATEFTLPKGTWTLEARAVDAAGNVDATPVSDTVRVKKKKKRRH